MTFQAIPCRAQDPRTCRYHGQEIKADEALHRGDLDGFLAAQQAMTAAIKTTPEILDFIASRQAATQPTTTRDMGEAYIPGRYPYTYAADHLRVNPDLVPVEIGEKFSLAAKRQPNGQMAYIDIPSRSVASQIQQAWAKKLGIDDQELAFQHAEAYMRDHGIVPQEDREQARQRMYRETTQRVLINRAQKEP